MITTSISSWLVCVWAGRLPPNHRLGRCTQDSRQTGLLSFTHSLAALGHQLRREGAHLGLVDRTLALGLLQARVVLLQRALGGKRGGGRRPTTAGAGAAPCPRGLGASRGAPAGPSQSQAAQTPASPARRPTCACRWCCGLPRARARGEEPRLGRGSGRAAGESCVGGALPRVASIGLLRPSRMDQPSKMDLRAGPFLSAITGDATREDDTTGAGAEPAMRLRPKEAARASISEERRAARCRAITYLQKNKSGKGF